MLPIQILGVNGVGYESGNASITSGRELPWLQDVSTQNVWVSWAVVYRDVQILDENNQLAGVYNLTEHDLSQPASYEALKNILIELAGGIP
ncbi:MAG: hypothetical protein ACKO6N_07135 [Myxococcota bacterium]